MLDLKSLFVEFDAPYFTIAGAWIVDLCLAYAPSDAVLLELWMDDLIDEVF